MKVTDEYNPRTRTITGIISGNNQIIGYELGNK